jgi:subtilisin family serine protease
MAAKRSFAVLLILTLLTPYASFPAAAQEGGDQITRDTPYVPGQVLVAMAAGRSLSSYAADAASFAQDIGGAVRAVARDGTAVLQVDPSADVLALAADLAGRRDVRYAEPNFIYWIPEPDAEEVDGFKATTRYILRRISGLLEAAGKEFVALDIGALQSMKAKRGGEIKATYPNDPYLWWNAGWSVVGADIVWPNTTASAGVCVIDTGVDYLHPDLKLVTVKGFDFVNADADPMDDHGHGTHVAGIIAATKNNKQGIAGVSTGKVVAVKALNAQGWGTSFDIAQAINFCGNRADVRVINMSLGSFSPSTAIRNALIFAVNTKNKLVVAAAGNSDTDELHYPAGHAIEPEFENKLLAVGASGGWFEDPPGSDWWWLDYWCKADYSNWGSWISVVAPGTDIYSTLPWDKPFYMNYFYGLDTRYGGLSGTSMATPFVAASAARRWGYKPLETNAQIGADVIGSGWEIYADDTCWPASMEGVHMVNVATLLERGALMAEVFDASTGLPLTGAALQAYQKVGTSTVLRGSAVITPVSWGPFPGDTDPTRIYMWFPQGTDIINLPAGSDYSMKVSKAGYTATPQAAFQHATDKFLDTVYAGWFEWWGRTGVPPRSTNFDAVVAWWRYSGYEVDTDLWDLDVNVWLPDVPNPLDPGQPAPFIVGPEGWSFGFLEDEPVGTLNAFPFALWKRDGGWGDWVPVEDTTIRSRLAHPPLAANAALPYYPGAYFIMVTDWGQEIDHDDEVGTPEIPLMGTYSEPYLYIWKDGLIKLYVGMGYQDPYEVCNAHWWLAGGVMSGVGGAPLYGAINECGEGPDIWPYVSLSEGEPFQISKE